MSHYDWLSRFVQMVSVTGELVTRYKFRAPWKVIVTEAPKCEIPYYVILAGQAILETSATGAGIKLGVGDVVLMPHGARHSLHDGKELRWPDLDRTGTFNGRLSDLTCRDEKYTEILRGIFVINSPHDRLLKRYLPSVLVIKTSEQQPSRHGSLSAVNRLVGVIDILNIESGGDRPGSYSILRSLGPALFMLALQAEREVRSTPKGLLALAGSPQIAPAMFAMFERPEHCWTVSELAALCGLSRSTLIRYFNNLGVGSLFMLLKDIRLSLAANELRASARSTEEIANSVGYRSVAAFRRIFTAEIGVTPKRWRDYHTLGRD